VGRVLHDDRADWTAAYRLFAGDVAYVWHAGLHAAIVATSLADAGFVVRSQIIWQTQHFAMGRGDYHWQHEPCWYAVRRPSGWQGDPHTVDGVGRAESESDGRGADRFKAEATNDYVVGLVAGQRGADVYLIDRYKAHASFHQTCAAIQAWAARYPQTGAVYVEDTANGPAVMDLLRHVVPGLLPVTPQGGKFSRAAACQPRVEAGNVYLPRPTAPNGTRLPERAWVEDVIEQLAAFPRGAHDDDVDAFTQLLVHWRAPTRSADDWDRLLRVGAGTGMGVGLPGEAWPHRWPRCL
jgi:predicted phage terminase large subunit-like protein